MLALVASGCSKPREISVEIKKGTSKSSSPSNQSAVAGARGSSTQTDERLGAGRTQTIAKGVHALGKLGTGCVYAIETTEGVILIDSGEEEFNFSLSESLLEVGLKLDEVKYVLLTHSHFDQVLGANEIRRASGAVVAAGEEDAKALMEPDLDAIWSIFEPVEYSGVAIEVDRILKDGETIELGDVKVQALETPGHTPGSLCYLIEKEGQRLLASGDVIASLNHGPAIYPAYLPPQYGGDAQQLLGSLNRLLEMDPPDLVLPSHASQHNRPISVRMDDSRWQALLVPARDELQGLIERRQTDGVDFLDDQPKEIEPGLFMLGTIDSVAVYCLRTKNGWCLVNAPGDDGLKEFLQSRLGELGATWSDPAFVLLTSDEENRRSGLSSVADNCLVFCSQRSISDLRREGVNALPWIDLQQKLGESIRWIDLPYGFACEMEWNRKRVLLTDSVPRLISLKLNGAWSSGLEYVPLKERYPELWNEVGNDRSDLEPFMLSLDKLASLDPQIWLPARPWAGQSANLYGSMWKALLRSNRAPGEKVLLRMAPSSRPRD